jgi:hypothetical protein
MTNSNNQWVINYFKQLEQNGITMEKEEAVNRVSEMQTTIEALSETLHRTRVLFERITNVTMRIKPIMQEPKTTADTSLKKEPEGHLETLQDQVNRQMRNNEAMTLVVEHLEKYAG